MNYTNLKMLIPSMVFCFRFLPFKQAIKIPIFVNKLNLLKSSGTIRLECDKIKTGMIRLGFFKVRAFPNTGVSLSLEGSLVFRGKCDIGNNSFIVCGPQSTIEFGDDFLATTSLRLISMYKIVFGRHSRIGWECMIMDTNFHPLYDMEKERFKKAFGPIIIGDYNWFGTRCLVMHSVKTPERCIFGATTVVTRGGKFEPYCIHGGNPVHVLSRNVMRVIGEDQITNYSDEE